MKKILITSLSVILVSAIGFVAYSSLNTGHQEADITSNKKLPKTERIAEAIEYYNELRVGDDGYYDYNDYHAAIEQADLLSASGSSRSALSTEWEFVGPDNFGGRTRALLVDKNNSNRYYAGGVAGGVWISEDAGLNWAISSFTDQYPVVSIDQASDGTIFIGTGEITGGAGSGFSSGSPGDGIYKSTDGGLTWSAVGNTVGMSQFTYVNKLAVNPINPVHIIAATGNGLWETRDGGATAWTNLIVPNAPAAATAEDVKFSPDGSHVYADINQDVAISSDGGMNFINASFTSVFPVNSSVGRVQLAVTPADPNFVYAVATTSGGGGCLLGVYKSEDKGATWTTIGSPGPSFDPFAQPTGGVTGCQGWYDCAIAANPGDENLLYVAGIQTWTWSPTSSWKRADVIGTEGGGLANPYYIHADKHYITFDPADPEIMLVGSDGGFTKSIDAISSFPNPSFVTRNKNYNVTQFYSVAAGINGEILGGTQDNGTILVDYLGNTRESGRRVRGGDGAYCDISLISPKVMFASIYFAQMQRSGNGGASFGCMYNSDIDSDGDCEPGGTPDSNPFIAASYLAESFNAVNTGEMVTFTADRAYTAGEIVTVQSNTARYPIEYTLTAPLAMGATVSVPDIIDAMFFQSTSSGLWVCPNPLNLSDGPVWSRITGFSGTVLAYASSADNDILYFGTTSGAVHKVEGLTSADFSNPTSISGLTLTTNVSTGAGTIQGIDVDENDANHVAWVRGGYGGSTQHVQRTLNGGTSVDNVNTGLPNMPIYDIVIDATNSMNYVVGSELGIWSSDDQGATWAEDNNEMGRVPVYRMRQVPLYTDGCPVIYAGTHGRGFWRTTSLTPSGCSLVAGVEIPENVDILDFTVYPNPVVSEGKISVTLESATDITLRVIDIPGRVVKEMEHTNQTAGQHTYTFDVSEMQAGTYLMSVKTAEGTTDSRMFIVSE